MKSYYSKIAGLLTVLALILSFSGIAMSQTETGSVVGVVTDPSGAVVPKANVTIKNVGTGAQRNAVTDEKGYYAFTNLLPALYDVTVEASGFAKVERRVQVTVGSRVTQDVALTIGAAQQIVEVTAEAGVAVNTETQTIEQVIDTKKILQLPTFNRNPYALVGTAANVSDADPSGRGAGVAINGLRSASTNILLDGASNNDEFTATIGQAIPLDAVQEFSVITNNFTAEYGRAAAGVVNVATKSGTNEYHGSAFWYGRYAALGSNSFVNNANGIPKPVYTRNQFGYTVGGPVLPSLKDKLFFFQSTEWTRIRSSAPRIVVVPTSQFIGLAAPATQNFFTTYGQRRSNLQILRTYTRGDLAAAGSDPCAPGSLCDTTLLSTTPVFDRVTYSRPSDSGGGSPQNSYSLVGRVDWNVSSKTQIYGRYALEKGDFLVGSNADSAYQGFDTGATTSNNSFLVSMTRSISPRLTMQSKIVLNRLNTNQPLGPQPSSPTLFFRTVPTRFLGDLAALPGYLPFSPGSGIPFGGPQNFVQAYQDLSYVRGAHQLRFGGSYVYIRDNRTFGAYQNPSATLGANVGQAFDNFLRGELRQFASAVDPQGKFPCRYPTISGQPCGQDLNSDGFITGREIDPSGTLTLPVGQPSFSRSNRYHEFAFYGQDSWRVSPRLTVNLGMRWEYFGVQHNKNPNLDANYYDGGGASIFERVRNGGVATVPNSPIKGLWKKDWNNFAPRLGFAWDVFGDGKTSLRGGWGISYERNFGNVTFNVIQNPPAYAVIALIAGVDVPSIAIPTNVAGPLAGSTGTKALPPVSTRNVDSNIQTAFAQFWSLTVEQQVLSKVVVAVDYAGSKGSNLYSLENPNRAGAGNVYLGDPCTAGNPFSCRTRLRATQYTFLNRRGNSAFSNHNALSIRANVNNPANTGLTLTFNYTWAHTFDNLSSTFSESSNNFNLGLLDPFNPKLDRGNADFDIRHRGVVSAIWNVPFARNTQGMWKRILDGWTVAPIFTASSGAPFSIFDCTNAFFEVCPRLFAVGAIPRTGPDKPAADPTTPATFTYLNLAGLFDSSYAHPITGTSEFGPYPSNMTGRNFFRGPGSWNVNFGIYKDTKINERYTVELRSEMFNAFNHANMFVLGSEADSSGTAAIRTRRDGNRNIQFTLKLKF
ncbi:MAG: TonB-dependent receptor [Acidobacteria bacterium]|nr:TonB-dependent receptor [Acidobacteriota bacterium]